MVFLMRSTKSVNQSLPLFSRRGFTLIEAMIASIVLAFCVVGVCGMLVSSIQSSKVAESHITATDAAKASMDRVAAYSLETLSPAAGISQTQTLTPSNLSPGTDADVTGELSYIQRHATQSPRDLAIVSVTATTEDGETVTVYRLMTRTELP